MTVDVPRAIQDRGALNLRDLGGLPMSSGGLVRRGRVFRSDYPAFVLADRGAWIKEVGLKTVLDLRRGSEAAVECVDWAALDVAYRRWPFVAKDADSWHARYQAYLEFRPESVSAAVRDVICAARQPVLFHCAAGKDRTGVLAALLLDLLGVHHDAIVQDYEMSAASVQAVYERLCQHELYATMLQDSSVALQTPRKEDLVLFFEWLRSQGGAERWLVVNGVPLSEIHLFREDLSA